MVPKLLGENIHGRFLREWKYWGLDCELGITALCLFPFIVVFDIWIVAQVVKGIAG